MPPKSLVELCQRAAVKNISYIASIGDLSYHLARPILLRVENPNQLHEIEENCPHIIEDCVELWQRLIKRDFSSAAEELHYVPKNPHSWHKVYFKYKRERDAQVAAAEARLAEQFDKLKQERARNETQILKPSEVPHRLRQSTVAGGGGGGFGGHGGSRRAAANDSVLSWGGGSRTKLTSGQSVLRRARREAAEVARRNAISGQLIARTGQIARAPRAMVNEHRIAANRDLGSPSSNEILPAVNRRKPGGLLASGRSEMEARLLRAKEGLSNAASSGEPSPRLPKPAVRKVPVVMVSDDEEDRDDDDDDDDYNEFAADDSLFGISPARSKQLSAGTTPKKKSSSSSSSAAIRRQPSPLALDGNDDEDHDEDDVFGERPRARPSSSKTSLGPPSRSGGGGGSAKMASSSSNPPAFSPPPPSSRRADAGSPSGAKTASRGQGSPPLPPGAGSPPSMAPLMRKRKAPVDIFMRPKRQAR